jgi:hypothetical protein
VTFVEAGIYVPGAVCAISVLWLLLYLLRNRRRDRKNGARGLEGLDELRWSGWTLSMGWAPVTCWRGCADLHRDDWWRAHLRKTCWDGCADLHRDDWWRAYVDQADEHREQTSETSSPHLQPDRRRVGRAHVGMAHRGAVQGVDGGLAL